MKARSLLIVLTAMAMFTCSAYADTTWVAGGDVSGPWTSAGSPYMITGGIRIPSAQSLEIGHGVTVFFAVRCSLYVDSAARLEAIGAEDDSVYFTADTLLLPERWKGIKMSVDADTCRFEWCVLEYANPRAISANRTALILRSASLRYNTAGDGHALYHGHNYLEMTQCSFISNDGTNAAVLLNNSQGVIEDCIFRDNHAVGPGLGGAMDWFAQMEPLLVRNCDFIENTGTHGGAVALEATDTSLVFEDCRFIGNSAATTGGAVSGYVVGGGAQFHGCLFDNNASQADGGALYMRSGSVVDQCVFDGNDAQNGGAIYIESNGPTYPVIRRSTFYDHLATFEGAAIYMNNWISIQSCAFVNCSQSAALRIPQNGQPPNPRWPGYNLFFDNPVGDFSPNYAGLGDLCCTNRNADSCDGYYNVVGDPLFVDPMNGEFHLLAESPCIDAGPDSTALFPFRDPDGTICDIGAFYYDQLSSTLRPFNPHPSVFSLGAYPNPFNSTTVISFSLPKAGEVLLDVFDITGRRVATVTQGMYAAGTHNAKFDAGKLPSGIYVYRLQAEGFSQGRKLVLLK